MKTIYGSLGYRGPNGETPFDYLKTINARYGFASCEVIYCLNVGDGEIDMEDFKHKVLALPRDATVMINLEGMDWMCYDNDKLPLTKPVVIARRIVVIQRAKTARPDCKFGFFSCVPLASLYLELNDVSSRFGADPLPCIFPPLAVAETYDAQLAPLAEVVDVLIPNFYFQKVFSGKPFTVEMTWTWAIRVFERCRRFWPEKRIMPVFWPDFMDVSNRYSTTDCPIWSKEFAWISEIIKKIRVPGELLAALFDAMDKHGVEDILMWNSEWQPWDASADWLAEALRWRGTHIDPASIRVTPSKVDVVWK